MHGRTRASTGWWYKRSSYYASCSSAATLYRGHAMREASGRWAPSGSPSWLHGKRAPLSRSAHQAVALSRLIDPSSSFPRRCVPKKKTKLRCALGSGARSSQRARHARRRPCSASWRRASSLRVRRSASATLGPAVLSGACAALYQTPGLHPGAPVHPGAVHSLWKLGQDTSVRRQHRTTSLCAQVE